MKPRAHLEDQWCCIACQSKFRLGHLVCMNGILCCPRCRSIDVSPADGATVEIEGYYGERGTVN